jgi:hypothetical protein
MKDSASQKANDSCDEEAHNRPVRDDRFLGCIVFGELDVDIDPIMGFGFQSLDGRFTKCLKGLQNFRWPRTIRKQCLLQFQLEIVEAWY